MLDKLHKKEEFLNKLQIEQKFRVVHNRETRETIKKIEAQ